MQRLLADATKLTGVKYDINNLSDVYSAIHAVQGELGITGTTAKEAASTFSGSFASMKAALSNVLGGLSLGQDIKPALQALAQTTSTFLFGNFIPMVGNILKGLPSAIVTFFQAAGPLFMQAGTDLLNQLGIGISSGMSGLMSSLDFSGLQSLVTAIVPAIQNAFTTMMGIVGPAIDIVVNSFVKMWNAAQPLISVLASALMPVLQILGAFLGGVFKGILLGVSATFDTVRTVIEFLTPVISFLINVFKACVPALTAVAKWVGTVIGFFTNLGSAGNGLKSVLTSAWTNIRSVITTVGKGIKGVINGVKSVFSGLGNAGGVLKSILSGAWNGIKAAISAAGNGIRGVINVIKSIFRSLGSAGGVLKGILSGAWNGIKAAISTAGNIIKGVINGVRSAFNILKSAGSSLRNGISAAWNGMKSVVSTVAGSIKRVVNGVKSVFNSLKNINLSGAGSAIMNGFLGGLKVSANTSPH